MKGWSKAVGVGLGYLAGGPIGAVVGYILGQKVAPKSLSEEGHLLIAILLGLSASLLKTPGMPSPEERQRTARFISRLFHFDTEDERLTLHLLDQFLALNLNIEAMARSFKQHADPPVRRQLLEVLFIICRLRGPLDDPQVMTLSQIAESLNLEQADWQATSARYQSRMPTLDLDCCFALLELEPGAPSGKVKAAYRRLAKKYHPDHSAHLDPAAQQRNVEVMALINAAYETIQVQRGL